MSQIITPKKKVSFNRMYLAYVHKKTIVDKEKEREEEGKFGYVSRSEEGMT